jgi:predicted transcriptional regulator
MPASNPYSQSLMPTSVLLSVKPAFASAIFAGTKIFEFRRALFVARDVERIVVYASSPIQRVIGEFKIGDIISMAPKSLWAETCHGAGISRKYFESYFHGCALGHAIGVKHARYYSCPRQLMLHYGFARPPQSFCYLD